MREELQQRCELFIENRDTLKQVLKMESTYMYPVAANILTGRQIPITQETLQNCRDLLKDRVGAFSNFRGSARLAVIAMLAVSLEPGDRLRAMLENYELLKKHFHGSEYLALVALLLAGSHSSQPMDEIVARGRGIYDKMKREHPFLTGGEDSVFAVLLAFSDKDDEALIADMEDCYQKLKPAFGIGDSLQSVSHVLALTPGATLDKCSRLLALYERLRQAGRRYGKHYELAVLAALSSLPVEIDDAVADMLDVDEFLSRQKGYGGMSIGKKTRLMHAAMLASHGYVPDPRAEAAVMSSTVAMIAAQQAAMCAAISANAAASH
ncbi:MAG: DUF4003 family protein [Clostridia bacterium]|nr:DUF4003 family protein [Clostridia bacterium]